MKVGKLRKILESFQDDDNVCVLVWDKACFDYDEGDEFILTDEAWAETCAEFDKMEFSDISDWIADTVVEKAEMSTERGAT